MEQMETSSAGLKEPIKLLETEKDFSGFDTDDNLLTLIENKIINLQNTIDNESSESIEKDVSSNNTPVNKKRKSELKTLTESNDTKHSQSVKRHKKENFQTEIVEPKTESNVQQSLELTTPTFNLTSALKNRRSVGRKTNVDISDPVFKLPFERGWKRELVYRTSGDSTSVNRSNRNGDVYYYAPSMRKLRSLREIQEYLDLSLDDNPLSIDSFTFLKQPIGMNDRMKELVRDANTKLSKDDSFVGVGVKSKKVKTPVRQPYDYELADDEKNKSPNKMKVVFKNVRRSRSRSKSKKDEKSNSEEFDSYSSPPYLQEYANKELVKAILSKTDGYPINNERRLSNMNSSPEDDYVSNFTLQTYNDIGSSMMNIFQYLKIHELLAASRVCKTWNMIATYNSFWQYIRLKNAMVYDWEKCVDCIVKQTTNTLDTKRMLIPTSVEEFEKFWLNFAAEIKRAKCLKVLELYRCPTHVVEDVIYSLPQLTVLSATSIKNPQLVEQRNAPDFMSLNLSYLGQMVALTEVRLKGISGIKLTSLPSFENLVNLETLSLTSIKAFPKDVNVCLGTVSSNLKLLEIGDGECLSKDFAEVLKRFTVLTSLRLENCVGRWDNITLEVFNVIRNLKKFKTLELVNIEFSICVEEELGRCTNIRNLLIIPAYVSQSATTNCHLIDCLKKHSKTLTHLVWGITHELLRVTDLFISQYHKNQNSVDYEVDLRPSTSGTDSIPILRTRKPKHQSGDKSDLMELTKADNVEIITVPRLEKLLNEIMPNSMSKVIKVPFAATTRVYLKEQFHSLK